MNVIEHLIPKATAERIRQLEQTPGSRGGAVLWETSIRIDDLHVLDVILYESRDELPWVDAVIFQRGRDGEAFHQVDVLDVADTVFGEYDLPGYGVTIVIKEHPDA